MTIFDYLVLFVLICSVLISIMRGLVKEVVSLVSWGVALSVATAYSHALAVLLPSAVPGQTTRLIVAFAVLFIGVKLLAKLLTLTIDVFLKTSGLSPMNRVLGGLFGLARGVLIVVAVVLACEMTAIPQQDFWKQAMLRPAAEDAARTVKPFLPDNIAQYIKY